MLCVGLGWYGSVSDNILQESVLSVGEGRRVFMRGVVEGVKRSWLEGP